MNVGDSVPVIIAGQVVANAAVKEMGEGTATLIIPATRVVMAVRTELAYEAPVVPQEQTTETIITGVERPEAVEAATVEVNDETVATGVNQVTQTEVGAVVEPLPPVEVVSPAAATPPATDDLTPTGHNPAADAAAQKEVPSE